MDIFIGTKIIKATAITRAAYNGYRGWPLPANENGLDDGYLVEYMDGGKPNHPDHAGYISWFTKEQFDLLTYRPLVGLTFGMALEALKIGKKVARAGWSSKGMFVYYVPANHYPAPSLSVAEAFFGSLVPYNAYMALKGTDNTVSTWAPSGNDALAEDWSVV